MYAAAGGASLASRQKRKNQAAQNKSKALLQQGLKDKLAASRASGLATPPKAQSRQFHNLPSTYLRTPQAQARKLSAGYTTQSRLLLPIDETNQNNSNQSHHLHHNPHTHHFHHHLHQHPPPHSPRTEHPPYPHPSISNHHLKKSATLPLVSQSEATPPASPATPNAYLSTKQSAQQINDDPNQTQSLHIQVPQDSIIVTPATPLASPRPTPTLSPLQLERKCSFYRGRKLNAYEDSYNKTETIIPGSEDTALQQHDYHSTTTYNLPNGGQKWTDSDVCELCDSRRMEICTCECSQGRAAWLERERRCSVQENSASCHRRWVKRNRIHDSSLGGSSEDDDFIGVLRGPSSFANAFLYVGLGTIAIGLVIAFVGTGEKGFKTVELRLIGPSLIGIGFTCCILRILFCICPSHCIASSRRKLKKKNAKVDADHTTSLLRGEIKRVSIARGPPKLVYDKDNPARMETLRHIATTSLFMHSEKPSLSDVTVPTIIEVDKAQGSPSLEMQNIKTPSLDVCSISDEELAEISSNINNNQQLPINNEIEERLQRPNKLMRTRAPVNQQKSKDFDSAQMETSLMIVNPTTTSILPSVHHQTNNNNNRQQQHQSHQQLLSPPPMLMTATNQLPMPSSPSQSQQPSLFPQPFHHQQQQQSSLLLCPPATSIESEIVLSPAKLGQ